MVALDEMEKAASIQLWQVELNDFLGTCLKVIGPVDAVKTAIDRGHTSATSVLPESLRSSVRSTVIAKLSEAARTGVSSEVEFNPLIQQNVVKEARAEQNEENAQQSANQDSNMADIEALGFIETQGFTAVFEAVDTACKAAQVEVVGKEKLGGGYVTIVIRGDVAAVRAAIEAAEPAIGELGTLIATHVIARPSEAVLSLLP